MSWTLNNWLYNPGGFIPWPRDFWAVLTRLGEAQILLPALLFSVLWMMRTPASRRFALCWLGATGVAATLTTLTKVAFIGFEIGYAPLDYSGISGHAMFSSAVLPVLLYSAATPWARPWPRAAALLGWALALAIAVSRPKLGVHSVADVVLGFSLGSAASVATLRFGGRPDTAVPRWVPLALSAWLVVLPGQAPPSQTHSWVTRLALAVSGREQPYTVGQMRLRHFRELRQQREAAAAPGPAGR